ncbi:alcohol dehydrogenase catalytic domain-containing protein [Gemmiger formicilis]|uniref:alcohol dehydrogenase catalytic domain-containing protein n=1 Tax=Gemmiger formicilis TaxID=745368 RepID=UPI003CFA0DDF
MSTTQQEQTRAAAPQEYLLEMRGITKAFAGVQALKGVDFYVRPGTVHALMGENGAGKSTLMKCLFGIYHKDEGTIKLRGQEVNFQSPHEALLNGISMVHQELEQVPGPGEVLVKVRASGLCVSDIHIQDGKVGTVHLPYTPGHEMAGVIVAVGKGVDPARIGEHISAAIDIICGECEFCRTGRTNLCRSLVRIGFERDGSHEEYCVIPAKNAFTVAPTIPFEEITGIPDAVGCMYNGLKNQAKLGIGQTLLILGVGGLGMNAIQIAKLMGATVGQGNVAMDAARCAKRLGAENVYIVYRRGMAELPARKEEVEHAEEEGIVFKTLTNPTEVLGDENGWVKGITCVEMELGEPDASGHRRPIVKEGSEFVLDVDTMIMALGTSPNPLIRSTTPGLDADKHGCLITNGPDGLTSRPMVYAGGDAVTGAATVILAMGAGKEAARAIDAAIKAKEQ